MQNNFLTPFWNIHTIPTLLAFLQAFVKMPSTQSLFWFKLPNINSCSSTTSGSILISLWAFSEVPALLVVEPRDPVLGDIDSASTSVWIQLLLPLPGGPATITPVWEKKVLISLLASQDPGLIVVKPWELALGEWTMHQPVSGYNYSYRCQEDQQLLLL